MLACSQRIWLLGLALIVLPGVGHGQIKQGPQRVNAADHGVGRYVPDASFVDLAGKPHKLSDLSDRQAVVVAMTSTSCPLSKKYLPSLAALAEKYSSRDVAFVVVNPISVDKQADMQQAWATLGGQALYVFDREGSLAAAVGATTTTDVIVLDPSRTIVYHGAIDDQYGIGYSLDAAKQTLLADALDAVLAGRRPAVSATQAPGCALDLDAVGRPPSDITYHNRISRIVGQHCIECHRDGGVAPFALTSYSEVVAHAAMIRQVVDRGIMPPWFAAPPQKGHVSPWSNDRSLGDSEKADLLAWLSSGKREGDSRDAPKPRIFADGWLIGKPDVVFEFDKLIPVKATGTMPYQNVTVATNLSEDKWVQAIEIRPGARDVVHHVLVFARGESDTARPGEDEADERMGYWGIYVPGTSTLVYPEGYAKRLPKGATFRFQMHYTPNGRATEDRTQIGLVFAKQPPRHEVRVAGVVNTRLNIPPGEGSHHEVATLRVPTDVEVLAFLPHMHLRGKAARYEVTGKDGTSKVLLDVPRYDFNWQLLYRYAEPLPLKASDTLTFTAWYDNSDKNPANPDPTKTVRWGPQTYDEMQLGYVEYIIPGAPADLASRPRGIPAFTRESLLNLIDTDGDGAISQEEFRQRALNNSRLRDNPVLIDTIFKSVDADSNHKVEKDELDKLRELILKRR